MQEPFQGVILPSRQCEKLSKLILFYTVPRTLGSKLIMAIWFIQYTIRQKPFNEIIYEKILFLEAI